MSRSRKKRPIVKDYKNGKWYNRVFRRKNKIRINQGKEPLLLNEVVNQYDISDWKFISPSDEESKQKFKRK